MSAATLPAETRSRPESLDGIVERLRSASLASDPGTTFAYSNENYYLLSLLAERVGNLAFDQIIRNQLFSPLGMNTSRVFFMLRDAQSATGRGAMLVYGIPIAADVPDEVAAGAGGVVSSASDLGRWLRFNASSGRAQNGERLLPDGTVAAMHAASAPGSNYGFGWRQDFFGDGSSNVHHSGIARTYTAHQSYFPDSGYAYAFVLNGGHFFRVEAASLRYGLDAILRGGTVTTGWPLSLFGMSPGFIVDNLVAAITALLLTIGIVGGLRARRWVISRLETSAWRIVSRMTPYVG